jgi:hypothetical protein
LVSIPILEIPISVATTVFPVFEKPVLDLPIWDFAILVSPVWEFPLLEVPDRFSISVTPIRDLPYWVCLVPFSISVSPTTTPPAVLDDPCPWFIVPPVPYLPAGGLGSVEFLPSLITPSLFIASSLLDGCISVPVVTNPPSGYCLSTLCGGPPSHSPLVSPTGGQPLPHWSSSSSTGAPSFLGLFPLLPLPCCCHRPSFQANFTWIFLAALAPLAPLAMLVFVSPIIIIFIVLFPVPGLFIPGPISGFSLGSSVLGPACRYLWIFSPTWPSHPYCTILKVFPF